MSWDDLLKTRVVFISGKGGVGKTTVAVLLGLASAQSGRNTLLVEMNSPGRIAPVFKAEPSYEAPGALAPNLSAINLTPKNCFEEYVLLQVRFKSIYELIFNNSFVTNFLEATPGLNEILMLGKIYDLERQKKNKISEAPLYDLIIVDMPATGHGLSAMEVPHVLSSVVKIGPLHSNAQKIIEMIGSRSLFSLVTLAEEMPVCETEEYAQNLKSKTNVKFGPLFVNAVVAAPEKIKRGKENKIKENKIPDSLRIYFDYFELTQSRSELHEEYLAEIDKRLNGFATVVLPYIYDDLDRAENFKPLLSVLKGMES